MNNFLKMINFFSFVQEMSYLVWDFLVGDFVKKSPVDCLPATKLQISFIVLPVLFNIQC